MTDIIELLRDLHKQATTERSHYYVASCVEQAIREIERLRSALAAEREECAKVAESTYKETVAISCPDGIEGCLVRHFKTIERDQSPREIAAAIRARK